MSQLPDNPSESFKRRNPVLYALDRPGGVKSADRGRRADPKRIRQSENPLMNKLEQEFYLTIKDRYPNFPPIRIQAKTFLIANGCRYTPDFTASSWPQQDGPAQETAFEVKGKHAWDDSVVKLKVFACAWTEVRLILAWKENGQWCEQIILPMTNTTENQF